MKTNNLRFILAITILCCTLTTYAQTAPNISYNGPQTYHVGTVITALSPTNTGGAVTTVGQTSAFVGGGSSDGTGSSAGFYQPQGIALDAAGNLFVADCGNNTIRKVTPAGVVTTIAGNPGVSGSADGQGSAATFYNPRGIALDYSGNIYVADCSNNRIRKITPAGMVSTYAGTTYGYADGPASTAQFEGPFGVAVDAAGNVFISEFWSSFIRKITPSGTVSTFAGGNPGHFADGTGTAAGFYLPAGIAFDHSGNIIVADLGDNAIRKITPGGVVTTISGSYSNVGHLDGPVGSAQFNQPGAVTVDPAGNIYVADTYNATIRLISTGGMVSTLSGNNVAGNIDGPGSTAEFSFPYGIVADASGNLLIADQSNNRIRKVLYGSYSIAPALPAGLNFNPGTGVISGTPTQSSAATTYNITAANSAGVSTTSLSISIVASDCSPLVTAPSANQNYIMTSVPRISGITSAAGLMGQTTCNLMQTVEYFDGLERPLQTVQVKGSSNGNDVVQPFTYNALGLETNKYLPYALTGGTSDGSYKTDALTVGAGQAQFYTAPPAGVSPDSAPQAVTQFDVSPLNRPVEQGASGNDWQITVNHTHTLKIEYESNDQSTFNTTPLINNQGSRKVALYTTVINPTTQVQTLVRASSNTATYPTGQLTLTINRDENWNPASDGCLNTTETYTDKQGHVVLKRTYNKKGATLEMLSTYYVYDDMGRLAFVLPPMVNADSTVAISAVRVRNLGYTYRYDQRSRISQKQLPGLGVQFTVYNTLDQTVATQDAVQTPNNQWLFTKYDDLGRTVMTGVWASGALTRPVLQAMVDTATRLWEIPLTTGSGYTNAVLPTSATTPVTINYYDNFINNLPVPAAYAAPAGASTQTRGLLVAKHTAVLNTPTVLLWDVSYYDDLARNTKTYAQHYLGGTVNTANYDAISTTYNFNNQPTTATRQHFNTSSTTTPKLTVFNRYLYDHVGRKIKTWQQMQNGAMAADTMTLLLKLDYNEIGQLYIKHLHSKDSTNFYQNIGYTYNERGWLLTSSAPLFAMQLQYNTGTTPQFNGNIANQFWGTPGSLINSYTYNYDNQNRLTSGITGDKQFIERGINYDQDGNITSLSRVFGNVLIDSLAYNYGSGDTYTNIPIVTDATLNNAGLKHGAWTYIHDSNGNIKSDSSKNITNIVYNLLNLPEIVRGPNITYTYDASGQKLNRLVGTTITDYISGIQYDGSAGAETISFIQTEEGRVLPNGATNYNYEYVLDDNLGNTRVTFDTGIGTARVVQQDNYLPFGMDISVGPVNSPQNHYLYNKKELQEALGEYDYGARFYDPVIARWTTIDPLAEKDRRWSPYSYGHNNPIRNIDIYGMFVKPGDLFTSIDDAAKDFGKFYNGSSIMQGREYASAIYKVDKDGKTYYSYTEASVGTKASASSPYVENTIAEAHSHGEYTGDAPNPADRYDDDHFSPKDIKNYKDDKQPGYVATPDGSLQKFDPSTNKTSVVSTDLPSDIRDPGRKNDISPITGNSEKKDNQMLMKPIVVKQDAIPAIKPPPPPPIKKDSH
jgi:RHS repeat-associated protein